MEYREHLPPAALAPWVACTWERRDGGGAPVRVVPDGCIDIIWTQGAGTAVAGANTTAFLVTLPARTHVVGLRLRPGAAPPLLGVDGTALRDARPALHELWGDDAHELTARLEEAADPAVARLSGGVAVRALAGELYVSERQLRRRVDAAVGYGPKRLARVLRLRRALAAAHRGEELARVAADAGYADQAHFAGDCRELAGVPPSALL